MFCTFVECFHAVDRCHDIGAAKNENRILRLYYRCKMFLGFIVRRAYIVSAMFPSHNLHNADTVVHEIPIDLYRRRLLQQCLVKRGCQHLLISGRLSYTLITNYRINTKTVGVHDEIMIKKSEKKLQWRFGRFRGWQRWCIWRYSLAPPSLRTPMQAVHNVDSNSKYNMYKINYIMQICRALPFFYFIQTKKLIFISHCIVAGR